MMEKCSKYSYYLIDKCQLNCDHCLYKLENNFSVSREEISLNHCLNMLEDFRNLGASKLTLMGGEPTLYGLEQKREPLFKIIEKAKTLGYEYIRMDSNAQFETELLDHPSMKKLDEITFSLDGPSEEINDIVRGKGSFKNIVLNIRHAIELNYNVNITCCIHKMLVERNIQNELYIVEMIKFVQNLGVKKINFHDLFKGGIPRDFYTGHHDITIEKWFDVWKELQRKIENQEFRISIRVPQSFVSQDEFDLNPQYYGYCSAKTADRILVHPNGIMRVCSLMIGTPYGVARYYDNKIVWDDGYTNELGAHDMGKCTACTNQAKANKSNKFLPLCVSFKPKQNEFIWKYKLKWETQRK